MNLVVLTDAETEANQTAKWYEEKQSGLGIVFLDELEQTFQRIESNPEGQPLLESSKTSAPQFRRCLLKRFPYLVVFAIREDEILVVAVAHAHQKPDYWLDRIS